MDASIRGSAPGCGHFEACARRRASRCWSCSASVLTAIGLARVTRHGPRRRFVVAAAATRLIVLEYSTWPLTIQTIPTEPPPVYEWLRTQPRQVTLEMPVPPPNALPL